MIIDVPKGVESSQLWLSEVLYSPEVGYTLISVGQLNEKGFMATFSGRKCAICGPSGEHVGKIPKTSKSLYWVQHERGEEANLAKEVLTIDKLHCWLGHISPKSAQKLVQNGFVTGLWLDPTSDTDIFCESCVYVKATRKLVSKTREGKHATEFGGEIHSDGWDQPQ